jgi:hypothetical protein
VAFEEDLVDVTALGGIERVEPEVVEGEQVDGDQSAHLALMAVVEARGSQLLVDAVASHQQDAVGRCSTCEGAPHMQRYMRCTRSASHEV